jgi:hypothetical protein
MSQPLWLTIEAGLSELSKRGVGGDAGAGFVVADIEAVWKPWEVRLTVAHAVASGTGGRKGSSTHFDKRGEILTIPTSDLRIDTGAGAPIVLYAVPFFAASAIDLAVVMTEGAPAKAKTLECAAVSGWGAALPGQANIAAEIPLSVANQVLRRLTWAQPLTIPANGDEVAAARACAAAARADLGPRAGLRGSIKR